jgi:MFS family permease
MGWRIAQHRLPDNADTGPDAPGLLIAMGLASLGMTLFQQLEPFLAAHLLAQASAAWAGALFITGGSAGGLICQPFWRALMLGYGARRLQQGVMVACLIAAALMLAPAWGPAWLIVWAILAGSLYGAAAGGVLLALWSRINASRPRDALARISRFSAGAKLGQALGLALAGWQIQNQPLALTAAMALALLPMMGAIALILTAAAPHRQPV